MKFSIVLLMCLIVHTSSQNITNTLGTNGLFSIKNSSSTYLSLSQSTGNLTLNRNILLPVTSDSTLGVIYKGTSRFIHNYQSPGAVGNNTFIGINSGNFTMSGVGAATSYNTAVGCFSLQSLTSGYSNCAFGYSSLSSNTTGNNNSAFGLSSLSSNTTGKHNSAFGFAALLNNITGDENSAFGDYSLGENNTGNYNSAFGRLSLFTNTTGSNNSTIGYESLFSNTTGYSNSGMGTYSLFSNSSGIHNTAVGDSAGYNITTGSNNTLIGYNAFSSIATVSNQITLGNNQITSLRCNVTTITSLSDARDKKNIKDLSLGLDFIAKLKPRQFNWDKREWYDDNISDGSKVQESPTAGFIAQELDEAQTTANTEWLNLVLKDNPEKWEATPGNLLPIMVKAIQELNSKCEDLETENDELKDKLAKFEQMQNMLALEIEKLRPNETGNSTDLTVHSK